MRVCLSDRYQSGVRCGECQDRNDDASYMKRHDDGEDASNELSNENNGIVC